MVDTKTKVLDPGCGRAYGATRGTHSAKTSWRLLVALGGLLAIGAIALLQVSCRDRPHLPGRIAFVSDRDGNFEIYTMDPDGSNVTRVTQDPGTDWGPAWSPDGERLAFYSNRDGDDEIYTMSADGSDILQLTRNTIDDRWPAWSPDSWKIAFVSYDNSKAQLFVINADGSGRTRLRYDKSDDERPSWSPDGKQIAFTGGVMSDVHIMNADGTSPTPITKWDGRRLYHGATWSPDGKRLALFARVLGTTGDVVGDFLGESDMSIIYTMDSNGSNRREPSGDSVGTWPAWSPDGNWISFGSMRDGNGEIYVMSPDGTKVSRLTRKSSFDGVPAWGPAPGGLASARKSKHVTPSGDTDRHDDTPPKGRNREEEAIAYVAGGGVFVVGADGWEKSRLLDIGRRGCVPVWSPDRTRMAFRNDWDHKTYVVNADGSNKVRLSNVGDRRVSWSPDGTRIAFGSSFGGFSFDKPPVDVYNICVVASDGSGLRALTHGESYDSDPAWSPDAKRIAFISLKPPRRDIFVMNADGSGLTQLTSDGAQKSQLTWSPDGARIAFLSGAGYDMQIYAIDPDGSNLAQLSEGAPKWTLVWSPNGERIAFVSGEMLGNSELWIMGKDGSYARRLASDVERLSGNDNQEPAWSPDGTRIAYVSVQRGICLASADGTKNLCLGISGTDPVWLPKRIRQ